MARAYSLDLRERVIAAVASGQSCRAVADRFGVSVARVVKWSQRFRATGSAAPKPMGGRRPYALEGERDWLLARVGEAPDLTLRALTAELAARGILVSHYAVWHLLIREGITFKKKPARQRTATSRRGAAASAMEEISRQA
jgi:transposase